VVQVVGVTKFDGLRMWSLVSGANVKTLLS
jgi:hypothetical protein